MRHRKTPYLSGRAGILLLILLTGEVFLLTAQSISAICHGTFGLVFILEYLLLLLFLYIGYLWLYKPYKETNRVLKQFSEGYVFQEIFELATPFSREAELEASKIKEMLDTHELISVSKKQAEYLALQNQINPHFLYNTLEGIRSEALIAGMDQIAEMTEALATFFRYTISHVDHLVTLEDELANIENYYIIQQFRFGERLSLKIEFDHEEEEEVPDILQCQLPKLTLQPIVENSICHGIEQKIGKGTLHIRVATTRDRLLITVSDDGKGMTEEKLRALSGKLSTMNMDDVDPQTNRKGGIAMLNVNNRIKLLFGEKYGINIYSTLEAGTDVEITLPLIRE